MTASELERRRAPDDYQYWDGQTWVRVNVLADGHVMEVMTSPTAFKFTRRVPREWAMRARRASTTLEGWQ